jgi:hypothetical protein
MSAPCLVATLPKNKTEELRVSLDHFNGHDLISLRVWFQSQDGDQHPGKSGLALRVQALPELIAALEKALAEADRRGLLSGRAAA